MRAVSKEPSRRPTSALVLVALGNGLLFYDLLVFSFFAVQIGQSIFPAGSRTSQLLFTLGTFGAGFLTRPLGAWVIGRIGDRRSRKRAILLSSNLAAVAVLGQILVPPFAWIGAGSAALMLIFRLLLGFAIGGQVGAATAFFAEQAPTGHRALHVSLQFVSQHLALVAAGAAGWLLATSLGDQAFIAWGWRAAMSLGLMTVPVAWLLHKYVDEDREPQAGPAIEPARLSRFPLMAGVLLLGSASVVAYGLTYLTVYAQATLGLDAEAAFGSLALYGVASICFDLVGGRLSDRWGRKPMMILGFGSLAATVIPAFMWLNRSPGLLALVAVGVWLSMWKALGHSAALASLADALPRRTRSQGLAIAYAFAVAIFGGTAQFISVWLTETLDDPIAPAYYVSAAALAGLAAMALLPGSEDVCRGTGALPPK